MRELEENVEERQTLIQAFERLEYRCAQLRGIVGLTETLSQKLNRTEGRPIAEEAPLKKMEGSDRNIVELFYFIADEMEVQINAIGNNTEAAMRMID
jgi:hypothetical protein